VILGGTNDLSLGRHAKDIYSALQEVWSIPLQHGTNVLALTVPETAISAPEIPIRRNKLNNLIKKHEAENL